jgi:hypothetical protein
MTEEDEAFNEIERRSKVKQEILQNLHDENKRLGLYEQVEPVAWMDADGNVSDNNDYKCFPIPLYTTTQQRTWVGLTDEEAQWLYDNCRTPSNLIDMTEAKLKEKNT